MKLAIVVAPGVGRVQGLVGAVNALRVDLADRAANDVAFPGEYIVRLPRSSNRYNMAGWWPWFRESVSFARRTWGLFDQRPSEPFSREFSDEPPQSDGPPYTDAVDDEDGMSEWRAEAFEQPDQSP